MIGIFLGSSLSVIQIEKGTEIQDEIAEDCPENRKNSPTKKSITRGRKLGSMTKYSVERKMGNAESYRHKPGNATEERSATDAEWASIKSRGPKGCQNRGVTNNARINWSHD